MKLCFKTKNNKKRKIRKKYMKLFIKIKNKKKRKEKKK